jgi:hypothetical protein
MSHRMRLIGRFLIAAALVLVVIGWVRSYSLMDAIHWTDSQHFLSLLSSDGRINLTVTDWEGKTAWPSGFRFTSSSRLKVQERPLWETDPDIYGRRRLLGFEWSDNLPPWPSHQTVYLSFFLPTYRLIAVPYWALAVLLSMPMVRRLASRWRRRSRLRRGQCPACAYDLRGTPGGCPECGWTAPAIAAVAASAPATIVPM